MSEKEITLNYLEKMKESYEIARKATDSSMMILDLIDIKRVIKLIEKREE